MASAQEPVLRIIEGIQKSSLSSSIPFSVLMIGIEKVMETEFLCPCKPVLNQLLAVFMFITPALLAFIIMLFLVRPCKHCSCCSCRKCCAKTFLPCLIPPVAWVIMLLLDGQYVACGLTFEQGNYISDKDDPLVKWCKSSSSDETEEKQLHQHIVGLSQSYRCDVIKQKVRGGNSGLYEPQETSEGLRGKIQHYRFPLQLVTLKRSISVSFISLNESCNRDTEEFSLK
ncbi:hypothetical protein SRHO_G00310590 [Serrasalmus rhombeus]